MERIICVLGMSVVITGILAITIIGSMEILLKAIGKLIERSEK